MRRQAGGFQPQWLAVGAGIGAGAGVALKTIPSGVAAGAAFGVLVTFEPKDEVHTLLRLHQDGWGPGGGWDQVFDYFDNAWSRVLSSLAARFTKGAGSPEHP